MYSAVVGPHRHRDAHSYTFFIRTLCHGENYKEAKNLSFLTKYYTYKWCGFPKGPYINDVTSPQVEGTGIVDLG